MIDIGYKINTYEVFYKINWSKMERKTIKIHNYNKMNGTQIEK